MPNQRDENKVVTSIGMHKDILEALRVVSEGNVSRFLVELAAEKMGFTLDEKDYPVGLNLAKLKRSRREKK